MTNLTQVDKLKRLLDRNKTREAEKNVPLYARRGRAIAHLETDKEYTVGTDRLLMRLQQVHGEKV